MKGRAKLLSTTRRKSATTQHRNNAPAFVQNACLPKPIPHDALVVHDLHLESLWKVTHHLLRIMPLEAPPRPRVVGENVAAKLRRHFLVPNVLLPQRHQLLKYGFPGAVMDGEVRLEGTDDGSEERSAAANDWGGQRV